MASPFSRREFGLVMARIQGEEYDIPESLSEDCKDLIKRCLTVNTNDRISICGIINHQWFRVNLPQGADTLNDDILAQRKA